MSSNKKIDPLEDVLKRALYARGWIEDNGIQGHRKIVPAWRHIDGEKAISLNDAIIKQLVREV